MTSDGRADSAARERALLARAAGPPVEGRDREAVVSFTGSYQAVRPPGKWTGAMHA